jgi:hypothetical protein
MPKKHALLSPSGAKRWLSCGPSARLESKLPDRSSSYADEGTFAHWLSIDVEIAYAVGKLSKRQYETELTVAKTRKYYSLSLHEYCRDFKSYVIEQYNRLRAIDRHTVIFLETELDLTKYIPEGFGTADIIIIGAGTIILIDLKFGQGVPVESEENDQLKTYGLGAITMYEVFFDIDIVELHIFQPRIDNTSSWVTSAESLLQWGEDVLRPGAKAAFKGRGDFTPGEHCQFCRVRPTCSALRKFVLTTAKYEQEPGTISPEQMSEILLKEDIIKGWLNAATEFALKQALENGMKWPEHKLVEGTSKRIIKDEEKAVKILQGQGLAKSEYTRTSLLPMGDLEKLIGKKKFAEVMGPVIYKPKGKPTLVHISDKRPELNNINDAFADVPDTE